ncbi:MAG TPA: Na/Pi cotransporter family protein [Candidatus Dormibacteraeota bacterium]|nr:Na/Pi cotransporter family protein [Candidatus Dormibacteraeota bacterium]
MNLLGGIALLLWGMRMVRTGIMRAFGGNLRRVLGAATQHRLIAMLIGVGVTGILQSSTATALMIASFAGRDLIAGGQALAVMLGANVGTTLVAQLLSLNLAWLAPFFLVVGVAGHLSAKETRRQDLSRLAIGIGLILLGLQLILAASRPVEASPLVRMIVDAVSANPLLGIVIGALFTWLAHSSLTTVLLAMSFAQGSLVPMPFALALVLGANLGGALPALTLTLAEPPPARRVALGNAAYRVVGVAATLPFIVPLAHLFRIVDVSPARQLVDFHTAFNVALAVVGIWFTEPIARLAARVIGDPPKTDDPARPHYLERSMLDTPSVALAAAARETLRMADIVAGMLDKGFAVIRDGDRNLLREVERTDDIVDRLQEAIKLYLVEVSREGLDDSESRRWQEIVSFSINLEHIGDVIDKNLMELAAKKIKYRLSFSPEGLAELSEFYGLVSSDLQHAIGVFISGDVKSARQLIRDKARLRQLELQAGENHLARLRSGLVESIETSSLHLDIIRDLKRIQHHAVSVAYPILEAAGELRATRLRELENSDVADPVKDAGATRL